MKFFCNQDEDKPLGEYYASAVELIDQSVSGKVKGMPEEL